MNRKHLPYFLFAMLFLAFAIWLPDTQNNSHFFFFEPLTNTSFATGEKIGIILVFLLSIAGLVYAYYLNNQVKKADSGTAKMQKIALAIRKGANAYLRAQVKKLGPIVVIVFGFILITGSEFTAFRWGRALAFLLGSSFSFAVGYCGMRLATQGNLKVAAAATRSYGEAMQIGYRTGTVTGMLTDSLGLLGGTTIFLIYGVEAYEALMGFGFGGTLIALFMRVGGGIYTKAADVGADLVGKIEKGIPEDDPRNAATIADNVGDNVGDCAGMAADIFESYEITIVAAMILGQASFGHIGVLFPLLVRGIGVAGSIISTSQVKADKDSTSDTALHSVHKGFWVGSAISVVGFFILGFFYLRFDDSYMANNLMAVYGFPGKDPANLSWWANLGVSGLDMRPAYTTFIGIVLAIVLNKITSYFTHTAHKPVKELAQSCETGHATNIIQGLALGLKSTGATIATLVFAIILSVICFHDAPAMFVAYGVAMTGIGMLTLTGNTISMDVFGPVADNANGIGEMGYDPVKMEEEEPGSYRKSRQILADLDAVGNTTKAETKGIAIGSAVIAATSLFSSFIAVVAVGSESKLATMSLGQYLEVAAKLTIADPAVFCGALLGAIIPFFFSSDMLGAVSRAAECIVMECRRQFSDPKIMLGTKEPDYARVVNICTVTAQKELVKPAILALVSPLLTGLILGPYALGGFLAGMIITGSCLAIFMSNAGGAWDNAKKLIEDGHHGGKGSDAHKAAVTGDTVGDPLKDTAGPAMNPLIKVMNMVGLLGLILVMDYQVSDTSNIFITISLLALFGGMLFWAFFLKKVVKIDIHADLPAEPASENKTPVINANLVPKNTDNGHKKVNGRDVYSDRKPQQPSLENKNL